MTRHDRDIAFEDSLHDDWSRDAEVLEVPIGNRPLFYLGVVICGIALLVIGRVIFLGAAEGSYDRARAAANAAATVSTSAPRGLIYDRKGDVLADNVVAFAAILDTRAFLKDSAGQSSTLATIQNIFGLSGNQVWSLVQEASANDFATPIVLSEDVNQSQLVTVQALQGSTIQLQSHFERMYPDGAVFSSVVGYAGRVTQGDLLKDSSLENADMIGKAGVEAVYDSSLRGVSGMDVSYRNARGQVLDEAVKTEPRIGAPIHLTIDGGLQTYFYDRLAVGLRTLNRTVAVGMVMNPQTGEILSLINLPGYDNNVFSSGTTAQIQDLFTSSDKPLFDRAVSGMYNPGSTIKPLDAVAALAEGVIIPSRQIYSPGYLLVPNPYNSSTPTRYLDWQPQGFVNLDSAIAQSSDVYFYVVGGGSPMRTPMLNDASDYGIAGLGISRLHDWWQTFQLGTSTGIDLPSEAAGFLPTPAWKQSKLGTSWLLGDTYNVSIGQGDLLLTPIQLLDYISAIANGGTLYRPFVNASSTPKIRGDLTKYASEIAQVQEAMRAAVTQPRGTAHTMDDLPLSVCAKTGSAQVKDNTQENALVVAYAPCDHPQVAILVLIENSVQGSLNAVPVVKDVMNWWYENRAANSQGASGQ